MADDPRKTQHNSTCENYLGAREMDTLSLDEGNGGQSISPQVSPIPKEGAHASDATQRSSARPASRRLEFGDDGEHEQFDLDKHKCPACNSPISCSKAEEVHSVNYRLLTDRAGFSPPSAQRDRHLHALPGDHFGSTNAPWSSILGPSALGTRWEERGTTKR